MIKREKKMATDREEFKFEFDREKRIEIEFESDREKRELYHKLEAELDDQQYPREEKLGQFLKSFKRSHENIDVRRIKRCITSQSKYDSKEEKEEEENRKRCIICKLEYDAEEDTYNWISGGLVCCSSPVHYSCLVRWRFSSQRNSDNQLIVWCPNCTTKTYIPAVWFFSKFGDVLEEFLRKENELYKENPYYINALKLLHHSLKGPRYFSMEIRNNFPTAQIMRLERKKLDILAATSEMMEKDESDGLEKFIQNYNAAKLGKYPNIPPLDSEGKRVMCV